MVVHYPAGGVTPHGAYHLTKGQVPMMWLESYDGSVVFDLMGGASIPDRTRPESVQLDAGGLSGLVPPWRMIDQKGATQDGSTFIDALYDPAEVTLKVTATGRDHKHLRRVVRDLIASIDARQPARLNFFSPESGHWWAPVRWFKNPPDANAVGARRKYKMTLVLRADDGFWRSHDHVDSYSFDYATAFDGFDFTGGSPTATTLGPNWPLFYYDGRGGGYPRAEKSVVRWIDDPNDPFLTEGRAVTIGPFRRFATDTDNQVVSIVIGTMQEFTFPDGAENHIWLRMGRKADGTWNGSGVRVSFGPFGLELSRFANFVETRMRSGIQILPPLPLDRFTAIAGFEGQPRRFQIQRNGLPLLDFVESGTASPLGPDNRGIGFGMRAGAAVLTQATPAWVREVSAGDNRAVSQDGFLTRINPGDQPQYDNYTCFGPGTFKFWLGPLAEPEDFVEFGPLLANQVVHIVTDPRKRSVKDLTSIPPTPQQLNIFQEAIQGLLSFAGGTDVPLFAAIASGFGITPPQGNLYSLLRGRFSDAAAIPAKSPGAPARPYYVKVAIDDGDANSKIIVSGTPRRRYPL